jgi:hypothetical protein
MRPVQFDDQGEANANSPPKTTFVDDQGITPTETPFALGHWLLVNNLRVAYPTTVVGLDISLPWVLPWVAAPAPLVAALRDEWSPIWKHDGRVTVRGKDDGVTALAVSVPAIASASVANSTLPAVVVEAAGQYVFTKAVVAMLVSLSPAVGVGAIGLPVKVGLASVASPSVATDLFFHWLVAES